MLVAPVRLAHRLARAVECVVPHEPRRACGTRQHERGEAAVRAVRVDRGAVGEQLAAGVLAVPLGEVRRGVAGAPGAGLDQRLGARQRLRKTGRDRRCIVHARLLPREQRVEGRDVAADGVAAEPDCLHERRAGAAERIQHEPARRAVPPDQRLGQLRRELAEVRMQAVDVLRALALRQRALGPRQLEVDLRIQRFLRPGHVITLVARADGRGRPRASLYCPR